MGPYTCMCWSAPALCCHTSCLRKTLNSTLKVSLHLFIVFHVYCVVRHSVYTVPAAMWQPDFSTGIKHIKWLSHVRHWSILFQDAQSEVKGSSVLQLSFKNHWELLLFLLFSIIFSFSSFLYTFIRSFRSMKSKHFFLKHFSLNRQAIDLNLCRPHYWLCMKSSRSF